MNHPFERAGLGKAPFRCVGVRENWYVTGDGSHRQPGGCCKFCGTGILIEYVIRSADGKEFVVGSDCVERTGPVEQFKEFRAERNRMLRQLRNEKKAAQRKAEYEERQRLWKIEREDYAAKWRIAHGDIVKKMESYTGDNSFVLKMIESFKEWGSLTDGQLNALNRILDTIEKEEIARAVSKHVGKVGERMRNVKVRVESSMCFGEGGGYYAVYRYLIKLVTEDGDVLVWWTSNGQNVTGEFVDATFTVKEHSDYKGVNQTVVQRVVFK